MFKEWQSLNLQGSCNYKRIAKVRSEMNCLRKVEKTVQNLLVVGNLDTRINVKNGHVQGKEVSFRLGRQLWGCILPLLPLYFKSCYFDFQTIFNVIFKVCLEFFSHVHSLIWMKLRTKSSMLCVGGEIDGLGSV